MCLNVLKRPVSVLNYKIISMYTIIDTSLNLLTGLFGKIHLSYFADFAEKKSSGLQVKCISLLRRNVTGLTTNIPRIIY